MTTRTELIARLKDYATGDKYQHVIEAAADMLEADGAEFRPDWVSYRQGVKDGEAELDKLREAARLALTALNGLFGVPNEHTGVGGGGVAVWRLGGSDAPRQAIDALKNVLVPPGYTAEELDRDNPYNQWMHEGEK